MHRGRTNQLEHVTELYHSLQNGAADLTIDGAVSIGNGDYLWGPIALDWLLRAAGLPGKSVVVAIALLFLRGRSGFAQVALRAELVYRFGVSRQTAYRALQHLEVAGLISVNRQRGRAPRVMFLGLHNDNLNRHRKLG